MNWVTSSLTMAVGSVGMYLTLRLSNQNKIPAVWNNLTVFLIPAIFFTVLSLTQHQSYHLTWQYFIIIFFVKSALFQYVASLASLKSIEQAPNPGYSLIISKSYAIFTAILSVFIFNSPLPLSKLLAIISIIFLAAFISIDRSAKAVHSHNWVWLALVPFFLWGLDSMVSKYLLNQGLGVIELLIYGCWSVSVISLFHLRGKKVTTPTTTQSVILLAYGLITCIFYYYRQESLRTAPNVGYVAALSTASIGFVTLASAVIFKDKISLFKFACVIGIIVSMYWLVV